MTKKAINEEYFTKLEMLRNEPDPDIKSMRLHRLDGFIDGLLAAEVIDPDAYMAMSRDVFSAYCGKEIEWE